MILRPSLALAKKIHAPPLEPCPLHADPMADWSARVFNAGRKQMVLIVNTASLYPCIFPGRGLTDPRELVTRATEEILAVLARDHLFKGLADAVVPAVDVIECAKPVNRSVIGSMNDQVAQAKYLHAGGYPIDIIVTQLVAMPMSVLKRADGRPYNVPRLALKLLLDRTDHSNV